MALGWEANTGGGGGGPLPVGGDLAGNTNSSLVIGLQGRPLSNAAPNVGDVIAWDGAEYALGAPPALALAGDLSGTTDAANVVALRGTPLDATPPLVGQVPRYDGAAYVPFTLPVIASYTTTLWVDPAGDPLSDGLAPSRPTTLDNALATVTSNGLILLSAGSYTAGGGTYTAATTCTLQAMAVTSPSTGTPAVRIVSSLDITASNVHVIGCRLVAVTDSSASAGTTRLTNCGVAGTITIAAPTAGQTLEITHCDFVDATVTTSSGGAVLRVREGSRGAIVSHATTGALTIEVYHSTVSQIVCSGGGALSTITYNTRITDTPSINVSSGTAARTTLVNTTCGDNGTTPGYGTLILTGAPAATVRIYESEYARSSSTIPAGAIVLTRGSAPEQNTLISTVTTSNPPASALTYISLPASGPSITLDPFTVYEFRGSFTLAVTANNVAYWVDLFINGVGSPLGALEEPLGLANAQGVRTLTSTFPGAFFTTFTSQLRFAKSALSAAAGSVTMKAATLVVQAVQ